MPNLTKKLRAGLLLLAGQLPETLITTREKVDGRTLLTEGIGLLPNGAKVDPWAKYSRAVQKVPANHGNRICKAFEQSGRAGVLAYCGPHIEADKLELFSAKLSELVPLR